MVVLKPDLNQNASIIWTLNFQGEPFKLIVEKPTGRQALEETFSRMMDARDRSQGEAYAAALYRRCSICVQDWEGVVDPNNLPLAFHVDLLSQMFREDIALATEVYQKLDQFFEVPETERKKPNGPPPDSSAVASSTKDISPILSSTTDSAAGPNSPPDSV